MPTVVVLVLAALRMSAQLDEQATLTTSLQGLRLGTMALHVSDALQHERDSAVVFVAELRADTSSFDEQVQRTDRAVLGLMSASGHPDLAPDIRRNAQRVLNELAGLGALRAATQQTRYPFVAARGRYTQILDVVAQLNRATTNAVSNLPVGPNAKALQALADMQDQMTFQNAVLHGAAVTQDLPPEAADDIRSARARFDAARTVFVTSADLDLRQRFEDTVTGSDIDGRSRLVDKALVQSAAGTEVTISLSDVTQIGNAATDLMRSVRKGVEQHVTGTVERLASSTRQALLRDQTLVFAGLMAAVAVMVWMTRLLIRPLRTLRRAALTVAERGLPDTVERILANPQSFSDNLVEPIPVRTGEEFGQVARAFDAVLGEAVRLAAQQAGLRHSVNAIFVNLSRRSQALVERQITVIDRLELDEQDPDGLSNLFELDHLATRMRRNNENLLVLAGTRVRHRVTKPAPITEVLGAAVSEIEKYAKVEIAPAPDVAVLPHVVGDLVHLLAELLDNATNFSDPDTKVTVRCKFDRQARLVVRIRDHGIGIPPEDLAQINSNLLNPPDADVASSQRMGLFVVAKLARQHHINVSIDASDHFDDGTSAVVVLPSAVLDLENPSTLAEDRVPATPHDAPAIPSRKPIRVDLFDAHVPHREVHDDTVTATNQGCSSHPARHQMYTATSPPRTGAVTEDAATSGADPMTERLPHHEAIVATGWFTRSGHDRAGTRAEPDLMTSAPSTPPAVADAPQHHGTPVVVRPNPVIRGQMAWNSAGDTRWTSVQDRIKESAGEPKTTPAGLPKREPLTHLLPGAVPMGPLEQAGPPTAHHSQSRPDRSSGLAGFQQGVRQGRHSLAVNGPPHATNRTNAPEEPE